MAARYFKAALKIQIGPHGINYHLEHHLYPSVPFFNLPALSRQLAQRHPEEIASRIRTSYWRAIGECLERPHRSTRV
jgi:fatty acid desaturase